jgi:putative phosphoribosyl transferase
MIFEDRADAGRQLARRLEPFAHRPNVIVLGVPRGGVSVAFEIASALHAPLDVFLSRKLGVPGQTELAFGAVSAGDGRYLDEEIVRAAGISPEQIEQVTAEVRRELDRRATLYRGGRPPLQVAGKTVILVDDGIATGASVYAALQALRQMKPATLVLAVPVAPTSTWAWLRTFVDEAVCLDLPDPFYAVGAFYRNFAQVEDEEVIDFLQRAERVDEVTINLGKVKLMGVLDVPADARGVVLFAHGSGSSRNSPRNLAVAQVLQAQGLATLLFDLLTEAEEAHDFRVERHATLFKFNIELLAERLVGATEWVLQQPGLVKLPIGYFGASTGAGAALVAAARLRDTVAAVVSRGGRPDLAAEALSDVRAPVLLLVGSKDTEVIALNREALDRLRCKHKLLVLIPGATHLFEEPGTLERVERAAADWFNQFLLVQNSSATIPRLDALAKG